MKDPVARGAGRGPSDLDLRHGGRPAPAGLRQLRGYLVTPVVDRLADHSGSLKVPVPRDVGSIG
eukprot:7707218-Heterocapsa_arctica.AAC.1